MSDDTLLRDELESKNIDPYFAISEATKETITKFNTDDSLTLEEKGIIARGRIRAAIDEVNKSRKEMGIKKFSYDNKLNEDAIAAIIASSRIFIKICSTDDTTSSDVFYYEDNPLSRYYGIYIEINEDDFRRDVKAIQPGFPSKDVKNVLAALRSIIPTKEISYNNGLCWLSNGIFNYKTKELKPFTSELISLSKSGTRFNPDAEDIELEPGLFIRDIIGSLSEYEDTRIAIYQVIGAAIRSDKKWNRMAWFFGRRGRNGKSMVATLIRNIVGPDGYIEMPVKAYSSTFGLSSIVGKRVLIASDSNSHEFINEPEALKAMTGGADDPVLINRKYKDPFQYRFTGLILMCMNDFPQFSPEAAISRRIFPVEFEKSFEDNPNTAIIEDYIYRDEVKEWIVKHVLTEMPDYDELIPSPRSAALLGEISLNNDAVMRFISEGILEDIMYANGVNAEPFPLSSTTAYQLFKVWCEREGEVMSEKMSKKTFMERLNNIIIADPECGFTIVKESSKPELYKDSDSYALANKIRSFFAGSKKYGSYIDQIVAFKRNNGDTNEILGMKPTRPTSFIKSTKMVESVAGEDCTVSEHVQKARAFLNDHPGYMDGYVEAKKYFEENSNDLTKDTYQYDYKKENSASYRYYYFRGEMDAIWQKYGNLVA